MLDQKMGYMISVSQMQYNADNQEENKYDWGFLHFIGYGPRKCGFH